MLFMGKTQQLVDVTVVNPTCPPHVDKAQKQLAVAEHAAQLKIEKYKEMAVEIQAEFVPFAIEAYGGLSSSARRLIRQISVFASDHLSSWSKKEIVYFIDTLCGWGCCAKRQLFSYDRWLSRATVMY